MAQQALDSSSRNVMSEKDRPQLYDNILKLAEAALIEVPIAAVKRVAGVGDESETYQAGWKAYDALVSLTNEATNLLYTNESFGRFAGRVIDVTAGVQRLNNALAGAFFATLWRTVGLPTADEIEALREDVRGLREQIGAIETDAVADAIDTQIPRNGVDRVLASPSVVRKPLWEQWTLAKAEESKNNVAN